MSTVTATDARSALGVQLPPPGFKTYAAGTFKVEKVGSLDDFKAKFMGLHSMHSLRPAVLTGETLLVHTGRKQQWRLGSFTLMIFIITLFLLFLSPQHLISLCINHRGRLLEVKDWRGALMSGIEIMEKICQWWAFSTWAEHFSKIIKLLSSN